MPANLITFAHFSVASAMSVPSSAGEPCRHCATQLVDSDFDLGIDEGAMELHVQQINDVGRGALRHADARKAADLTTGQEPSNRPHVRQHAEAGCRRHREDAQFAAV
jgi:hypothetical protein